MHDDPAQNPETRSFCASARPVPDAPSRLVTDREAALRKHIEYLRWEASRLTETADMLEKQLREAAAARQEDLFGG